MATCPVAFGADEASDCGPGTVSSNHQFSRYLKLSSINVPETDAAHPVVARTDEVDEPRFEGGLGTSFS